jgi:AraC-like DNA-binding protein
MHRGHTLKRGRVLDATVLAVLEQERSFTRTRSQHRFWAIDYLFSPTVRVRVGFSRNRWVERRPFTLRLYEPGRVYWEESQGNSPRVHSAWIAIIGRQTGLESLVDSRTGFAHFDDPDRRFGRVFQEGAELGDKQGDAAVWGMQSLYYHLAEALHNAQRISPGVYSLAEPVRKTVEKNPLATRVDAFLHDHIGERIELRDVAKAVGVSVSLLSHTYTRETGESPMKALCRLRVKLTRDLLLKGHTLKYIAAEAGFCNEYHLSKVFKQAEGMAPRHFLKHTV